MARNFVIIVLAALLGASSYLLYKNKNITINIGNERHGREAPITREAETEENHPAGPHEGDTTVAVRGTDSPGEEYGDKTEVLGPGVEPEIHLDPTVGMTISSEQQIVSSYKIIGPRKFSLLTDDDETMVEIDLDSGRVKVNPKYDLDEVTTQFWKSVGKKYPEVCFAE